MSTRLIVPPAALAVSMEAARLAARVDAGSDGTSALDGEIADAVRTYTKDAETETNRAIMEQTWRVTLDAFPSAIKLDKARLLQVEHVKYYDVDNVQRTLNPLDYQVDAESEPGYIVPAPGCTWPATARRINAVEVQYRAGYGSDHSSVPPDVQGFIVARIREQFDTGQVKNEHVLRLLWGEKVYL